MQFCPIQVCPTQLWGTSGYFNGSPTILYTSATRVAAANRDARWGEPAAVNTTATWSQAATPDGTQSIRLIQADKAGSQPREKHLYVNAADARRYRDNRRGQRSWEARVYPALIGGFTSLADFRVRGSFPPVYHKNCPR